MPLINEDFIVVTDPNGYDNNIMTNQGSARVRETFNATEYLTSAKYIADKRFDLHEKWFPSLYAVGGTINLTGSETFTEIKIKGFNAFLSTINANTKIVISDSAGTVYDQILTASGNDVSLNFGDDGMRIIKTNPGAYFIFSIVNGAGSLTLTGWKN